MMNNILSEAIKRWDDEVDTEAANLIENGVPPFEARREATLIVSGRRREKKLKHGTPN